MICIYILLDMAGVFKRYPVLRGMAVYTVLAPAANATQQVFDSRIEKFNPYECLRFGILGTFLVAPTLYGWIRLVGVIIRGNTFRDCVLKAYVEQFTWAPFAYTQFYIGISALEGKSFTECIKELKAKFWATYKTGFFVWPVVQTVNFRYIPEKNRVPFISLCSYLWNVFLSYMHNRKRADEPAVS